MWKPPKAGNSLSHLLIQKIDFDVEEVGIEACVTFCVTPLRTFQRFFSHPSGLSSFTFLLHSVHVSLLWTHGSCIRLLWPHEPNLWMRSAIWCFYIWDNFLHRLQPNIMVEVLNMPSLFFFFWKIYVLHNPYIIVMF